MINLDTYFLEVGARFSVKVATKAFLRGKKTFKNLDFCGILLKQKWRNATKTIEVFAIDFTSLYLA